MTTYFAPIAFSPAMLQSPRDILFADAMKSRDGMGLRLYPYIYMAEAYSKKRDLPFSFLKVQVEPQSFRRTIAANEAFAEKDIARLRGFTLSHKNQGQSGCRLESGVPASETLLELKDCCGTFMSNSFLALMGIDAVVDDGAFRLTNADVILDIDVTDYQKRMAQPAERECDASLPCEPLPSCCEELESKFESDGRSWARGASKYVVLYKNVQGDEVYLKEGMNPQSTCEQYLAFQMAARMMGRVPESTLIDRDGSPALLTRSICGCDLDIYSLHVECGQKLCNVHKSAERERLLWLVLDHTDLHNGNLLLHNEKAVVVDSGGALRLSALGKGKESFSSDIQYPYAVPTHQLLKGALTLDDKLSIVEQLRDQKKPLCETTLHAAEQIHQRYPKLEAFAPEKVEREICHVVCGRMDELAAKIEQKKKLVRSYKNYAL